MDARYLRLAFIDVAIKVKEVALMNTKAKLIVIAIMIVIIVATTTEKKSATRTETVTVTECVAIEDYYEITVEDSKGNLWGYYDDNYYNNGKELKVTFNGNEIVDAEVAK